VWDQELKKKLEFNEPFTEDEQNFYDVIQKDYRRFAFITTYYVVKCKGDAHILLSGPNNSGKTNTAILFLACCNKFLVDFWHVKKYNEMHLKLHPELRDVPQRKFSIIKDVFVTPDSDQLKERFVQEQFQTIDINEGMEAATNLQSNKAEAVELGVKRFTTRSYHNIIVWEYQVQQRPTAMMLEGMNFWIQKMRKRHFVLSMASTLVRKKDPYYMKELDKCRTDNQISYWMKYINPNYIHTFKAPKLKAKYEKIFQNHYWAEKDRQSQGEKAKSIMTAGYSEMVEEVWTKINKDHTLTLIELGDELTKRGFKENDVKSFMRDYGRYNRTRMWQDFNKKKPETEEVTV
jgi:hypothetical protein